MSRRCVQGALDAGGHRLKPGVILYEMHRQQADVQQRTGGLVGNSGSSLHAKAFVLDERQVFVWSFSFDQRSERLNTEIRFVIYDPGLPQAGDRPFDEERPDSAHSVILDKAGWLCWLKCKDGREVRHYHEPGTGWLRHKMIAVVFCLPIE